MSPLYDSSSSVKKFSAVGDMTRDAWESNKQLDLLLRPVMRSESSLIQIVPVHPLIKVFIDLGMIDDFVESINEQQYNFRHADFTRLSLRNLGTVWTETFGFIFITILKAMVVSFYDVLLNGFKQ